MCFYSVDKLRLCVLIIIFNVIVSCSLIGGEGKGGSLVTQDMIGGMKTDDMKKLFGCNYILDFDKNGYQIWKISYSDVKLFLFFNKKNILEHYKYVGETIEPVTQIIDDLPYYIPKDAYLSRQQIKNILGKKRIWGAREYVQDSKEKPILPKTSEEKFLKMLDSLLVD